jgi:predicted ATP-dependent protease
MPFVPTLQFQQAQKALQQKKASGEIDEIEYTRQLDELIAREVHAQQDAVVDMAIQELREAALRNLETYEREQQEARKRAERERAEADLARERYKREEEERAWRREQEQKRRQEEEEEQQRQARYAYRYRIVPNEIATLKQQYSSAKCRYTWLQIASIVFSIATTTLVGTDLLPRYVALICSGLAAMAAAMLSTFRMREHNFSYYQAISSMESETHDYDQRVGGYKGLNDEDAYLRFAARISEIKQQYMSQELSMWKAAEPAESKPAEELPSSRGRTEAAKGNTDEGEQTTKSEKAEGETVPEGESERAS